MFSDSLARLSPYVPGEQPKEQINLKLNTNENPYPASPAAIKAMHAVLDKGLELYPDYASRDLCKAIAKINNVDVSQVFVGNGSDEVLAHIYKAFFQRPGHVLVPDISYSFYSTYGKMFDINERTVPLDSNFAIDPIDYIGPHKEPIAGIIFANPNAPTGIALSLDDISKIAAANSNSVVVVDEAYVDFGAESAVKLLDKHANILVVQTFSKSRSLAGLRVGFAIANQPLIQALNIVKDSFNSYPLDSLAQAGATASMLDYDYFLEKTNLIINSRQYLANNLKEMNFSVLPSKTNFVFAKHNDIDASLISAELRKLGILVRHFDSDRIKQYLRITIGTMDQCNNFLSSLDNILNKLQD